MRSILKAIVLTLVFHAASASATTLAINTPNDGHNLSKLGAALASASLAVGPVPATAGQALQLQLPAIPERVSIELYSLDMRLMGQVEGRGQNRISLTDTYGLAAGVYVVKVTLFANCTQRVAYQKVVIKR